MRHVARRSVLLGSAAALAVLPVAGWMASAHGQDVRLGAAPPPGDDGLAAALETAAEPLPEIADPGFAGFIDRYADAKVVLLGESTHGTDEFYRARAAITERLVREHGFSIVAVEADWPDAARIDAYIRGRADLPSALKPFQRFPAWMWRNRAVGDFVERLRAINDGIADPERHVGFYGLDMYSLPACMDAVTDFVKRHDPAAIKAVQERYGCLAPFVESPETYAAIAANDKSDTCSDEVLSVVAEVLEDRMATVEASDGAFFHALQNARVVAASEAYYRAMYEGSASSWNLRDTHMFETLKAVFAARGAQAKAVVWAHNSHIGDASASQMGEGGEINIGQLCRQEYGEPAVLIGFGTDRGSVTAASRWGGPAEVKTVRPSLPDSWGAVMREVREERFFLDLRRSAAALEQAGGPRRPERFIGVLYLPETERASHYAEASLHRQFDGYVWLEVTRSVEPLSEAEIGKLPQTHPFSG